MEDLRGDVVILLLHEVLFRQRGLVGHELDPVGFDVLLHVVPLDKPPKLNHNQNKSNDIFKDLKFA